MSDKICAVYTGGEDHPESALFESVLKKRGVQYQRFLIPKSHRAETEVPRVLSHEGNFSGFYFCVWWLEVYDQAYQAPETINA